MNTRIRIKELLDQIEPLAKAEILKALKEPGAQIVRQVRRRADQLQHLEDLVDLFEHPTFGRF